jgi:Domain of unknown function (DUF4390)
MHPTPVRSQSLQGLRPARWVLVAALGVLAGLLAPAVRAQGIELSTLKASRTDSELALEFAVRINLPRTVDDALRRGVPIYFVAQAELFRHRWYWRDERVASVARSWRIAYQPLTNSWRVGLAGLNQTQPTLADALNAASSSAGWKLADLSQLDPGKSYYIEFSYRLDTSQLPGPMQFGLTGLASPSDWSVGVARTIRVDLGKP